MNIGNAYTTTAKTTIKPMSSFVRVVRRWPNAGFGSYLLTTIDTVAAILEAGLIPVVDYRHRKSMQLYRTYEGENVWDTFFNQRHCVAEAVECPELSVDFGKRQKVPRQTYYESRSIFQSFVQPREAVDHFATQRINYRIGQGVEYDCIYYRGTDKRNERRPVPFERYDSILDAANGPLVAQTDQQSFVDYVKERKPDVIVFPELRYSATESPLHQDSSPGFRKGVEAWTVIRILAGARRLYASRSNMTTVANLMRTDPAEHLN